MSEASSLTKHSRFEHAQRTAQTERMKEIEAAWTSRIPADTAAAFRQGVAEAQSRPPVVRVDMAPGTLPNPPRPGREPKPAKSEAPARSRRY